MFFTFFRSYKWYQIAKSISHFEILSRKSRKFQIFPSNFCKCCNSLNKLSSFYSFVLQVSTRGKLEKLNNRPLVLKLLHWINDRKQPFADVLQNRCSLKLRSIHRETLGKHLKACNFTKKRLQHRGFPVNIVKILRTAIFIEHIRWLLLKRASPSKVDPYAIRDITCKMSKVHLNMDNTFYYDVNPFQVNVSFYTPWKRQKTGGIETEYRPEIG